MFGLLSGGKIEIIPDKQSYALGETVNLTILLKLGNPLKAKGLYARVRAFYKETHVDRDIHHYETDSRIRTHTRTQDVELFAQEFKLDGEKEYPKGEARYAASFQIPQNQALLPTSGFLGIFGGRQIIWEVVARLDMPMAFDVNSRLPLNVHQ